MIYEHSTITLKNRFLPAESQQTAVCVAEPFWYHISVLVPQWEGAKKLSSILIWLFWFHLQVSSMEMQVPYQTEKSYFVEMGLYIHRGRRSSSRESAILHQQFSTVAQNGQTEVNSVACNLQLHRPLNSTDWTFKYII